MDRIQAALTLAILLFAASARADSCLDASTFTGTTGGAKIQNAINACASYGCVICVPANGPDVFGTWLVTTPITLRSNVTIRGNGGPPILLKSGSPSSILSLSNLSNVQLSRLRVDGGGSLSGTGISGSASDVLLQDLVIVGFDGGVLLTGSRIAVERSEIASNGGRGIQIHQNNGAIDTVRITSSRVHDNGSHGIVIGEPSQIGSVSEVIVSDNVLSNNGTASVGGSNLDVDKGSHVTIIGNHSALSGAGVYGRTGSNGIALSACTRVSITGNVSTHRIHRIHGLKDLAPAARQPSGEQR